MCEYKEKCWRYWYSVEFKRKSYAVPPTRENLFLFHPIPTSVMSLRKSLYCENMPSEMHPENLCPFLAGKNFDDCHEKGKADRRKVRQAQKKFPGQELRLTISRDVRKQVAANHNYQCIYCGRYQNQKDENGESIRMVVDHFVPLALGGHPTDLSNLVLACKDCNREKGTELWEKGCRKNA